MKFEHLDTNNQTYGEHFKEAIHYSFESFKCSIYFFIHALWPDSFKTKGSSKLNNLTEEIKDKYIRINNRSNIKSKKIILKM
jgi:hypothetical protein